MFPGLVLKLGGWLLGGGITSILAPLTDVYKAKLAAGEDHDKLAADLAGRQLVLDQREAELQANIVASEPGYVRQLFAYPVVFYVGKILVWDKALHMGVTDPIDDRLFWIMQTIIISYFGARTVRDVVTAFRTK